MLDGAPAAVATQDGRPTLRIAAGTHRVEGRFRWQRMPAALQVDASTGIVDAARVGEPALRAELRDGRVWLRPRADRTVRPRWP